MPSEQAQKIINAGLKNDSVQVAELVRGASDELLLEVLAGAAEHHSRTNGLRDAVEFERQRRDVGTQMEALQAAASGQIGALRDVEAAARDQIKVTERLETRATKLQWVAIAVAVAGVLAAAAGVFVAVWDRLSPAPVVLQATTEEPPSIGPRP